MSKELTKDNVIRHKKQAIKQLNNLLEMYINNPDGKFRVNGESYVKKLGETELISLNPNAQNISLNESAGYMGKVIGKLPCD